MRMASVTASPRRPFTLNNAGNCCQGWSSAGKKERFAHASERAHAVWLAQRSHFARHEIEDCFFEECTDRYPWEIKLREALKQTHQVVGIRTNVSVLGHPSRRPRVLTSGLALSRWRFVGPDSDAGVQAEFEACFRRCCILTGIVYFQAPNDLRREELNQMLRSRGKFNFMDYELSGDGILAGALCPS